MVASFAFAQIGAVVAAGGGEIKGASFVKLAWDVIAQRTEKACVDAVGWTQDIRVWVVPLFVAK